MRDDKVSDVPGSTYPPPRARECSRDYNSSSYLSLSFIHPYFWLPLLSTQYVTFVCVVFSFDGERKSQAQPEKKFFVWSHIPYRWKGKQQRGLPRRKRPFSPLPTLVNKTSVRLRYIYISKALLLLLLPSIQPEFRAHLHGPNRNLSFAASIYGRECTEAPLLFVVHCVRRLYQTVQPQQLLLLPHKRALRQWRSWWPNTNKKQTSRDYRRI